MSEWQNPGMQKYQNATVPEAKMVKMPEARTVSKTLSELVQETNKHVLTASQKPSAQPAAKPVVASQPKSYRPAWVDEFNQETTESPFTNIICGNLRISKIGVVGKSRPDLFGNHGVVHLKM